MVVSSIRDNQMILCVPFAAGFSNGLRSMIWGIPIFQRGGQVETAAMESKARREL